MCREVAGTAELGALAQHTGLSISPVLWAFRHSSALLDQINASPPCTLATTREPKQTTHRLLVRRCMNTRTVVRSTLVGLALRSPSFFPRAASLAAPRHRCCSRRPARTEGRHDRCGPGGDASTSRNRWTDEKSREEAKHHEQSIMNRHYTQVFVVPTEPVGALVAHASVGDLISEETALAAQHCVMAPAVQPAG